MASGYVNRTQRPNTWLHRPSLRREVSPCQLERFGSFRTNSGHAANIEPTLMMWWTVPAPDNELR